MRETPDMTITLDPVNQLKQNTLKNKDFDNELKQPKHLQLQKNKSVTPGLLHSFSPLKIK